ncbi:MAG: CsoS2 family carboxysome shell protein, partial [Thioalkalivibrio sp.]|nr:CsoS2 family carboxysome shell protein [Thioalkalivibrio sp.]
MPQANESTASATLSGRELALKRRKAMALHGKSAFVKTAANRQGTSSQRAPAAVTRPATPSGLAEHAKRVTAGVRQPPVSAGREAARARREALSVAGKAALKTTSSRPSGRVRPTPEATHLTAPTAEKTPAAVTKEACDGRGEPRDGDDQESRPASETLSTSLASSAPAFAKKPMNPLPKGRALARARREALSQSGKAGLVRAAHMARVAAAMPDQDWQSAISNGASGRQIAMQRRKVQSMAGRTAAAKSSTQSRPSGRKRVRLEVPAPPKVEKGHTLSGQTVTGTMVERSNKQTGNEPGVCRAITGTEYIGAELYERECPTRPAPAPTKVGVSTTTREHKVTGTEVGRSMRVTGDEIGACKGITGTEY